MYGKRSVRANMISPGSLEQLPHVIENGFGTVKHLLHEPHLVQE